MTAFRWGQPGQLGSAAYWVEQTRLVGPIYDFRLGGSLEEEVAACLLGGFGIRAEAGLAAFYALRSSGLLTSSPVPSEQSIEKRLVDVLELPDGRRVRYRFPRQRARRIAAALRLLAESEPPDEPRELRRWLQSVEGIGPKTASWIVRNRTGSEDVAVIDIHVRRAGVAAGFFRNDWILPRDYSLFEEAFLLIARLGGVSAPVLDACIWRQLRFLGQAARTLLTEPAPTAGTSLDC